MQELKKFKSVAGEYGEEQYKDYQKEMDMINLAFCEVMMEGDAAGRSFSFPIPTYNITQNFAWDNPVVELIAESLCPLSPSL